MKFWVAVLVWQIVIATVGCACNEDRNTSTAVCMFFPTGKVKPSDVESLWIADTTGLTWELVGEYYPSLKVRFKRKFFFWGQILY